MHINDFIDARIIEVLRTHLGGTPATAEFIVDMIDMHCEDKQWHNIKEPDKIFFVRESLMRLLRQEDVTEKIKTIGVPSQDDIEHPKRRRQAVYQINYAKLAKKYSQ